MEPYSRMDAALVALALTELSVHYEDVNPRLSEYAWQLAADLMLEYDLGPEDVDELAHRW